MDWNKSLAREIAKGLIKTGIEGGYDSVTKSTAYDYPSIGVSQRAFESYPRRRRVCRPHLY